MSHDWNEGGSGADGEKKTTIGGSEKEPLTEEQAQGILEASAALKAQGNALFRNSEFQHALVKYTAAVSLLKQSNLPTDGLILLNRTAAYLALKLYGPALKDATQGMSLRIHVYIWKSHFYSWLL